MKKNILLALSGLMMLTSCSSTGEGAMSGAMLGGWFGSAIGGIMGGRYGSDVGTLVGMTTGAVAGAAAGHAQEKQDRMERARDRESVREHYRRTHGQQDDAYVPSYNRSANSSQSSAQYSQQRDDSGFDATNSGDDRIYDFQSGDYTGNHTTSKPESSVPTQSQIENISQQNLSYSNALEISNARFLDRDGNGVIHRGETAKIIFEIKNTSDRVLYDLVPTVVETSRNKHLFISPSMHIESIAPGQRLRYTAVIAADKFLKDGKATFSASVVQGGETISKVTHFNVVTRKK